MKLVQRRRQLKTRTRTKEGLTTTSQDKEVSANNKGGTTRTSEDEDANNQKGATTTSEYEDASNKGGTTMTSDDEDKNNKEGTTMTCQDNANNKQMTADTTLYCIIHNPKVECFKDLDDTFPFIEEYKRATGNRLGVQQFVLDKYRVYRCCSHVKCPFLVRFSRRLLSDGKFVLSRMNPKYSAVPRPNRAVDGRRLKKHCQGKLGEVVTRVLKTKEGLPVPKDMFKMASNKEYNKHLPYMVA